MHWTDRVGRRLNPHDLHIFMAVVEQGNMARAADSLAISRPVVSRTIAGLEHALGVRLLDRGPHGVEPTLYGRALLKRSVAVFDELKQSVRISRAWAIRIPARCASAAPSRWRRVSWPRSSTGSPGNIRSSS